MIPIVIYFSEVDHTVKEPQLLKRPYGYWTNEGNAQMRTFLDNFAHSKNFDPLVAENWYSFKKQSIIDAVRSHFVIQQRFML
jgi:hypothetical protein